MRKTALTLAASLFVAAFNAFAQDRAACEKIVAATVEAINSASTEPLEAHLAPDFVCSGQEMPMARMVLDQIVKQLGKEVKEHTLVSESTENGALMLVYDFVYADKPEPRATTFVFDDRNRLKRLDLFTVQVMKFDKDAARVEKSAQKVIDIPVEIREHQPIAQATINGESRAFFVDSGAPVLILNSKYYKTVLPDGGKVSSTARGVNGSVSGPGIFHVDEFDFGGIKVVDSDVMTTDLSNLEETCGIEIHGLVGHGVYKDYDMLFDYDNATITLIDPTATDDLIATRYAGSTLDKVPLTMRGHIPVVKGSIGGRELNLGFDSGAGGNLLDAGVHASLGKQVRRSRKTELSGAGESQKVESGRIRELVIGSHTFRNTFTVFNDMSHLNAAYKTQLEGLFGYEVLSRQKMLVSFQNGNLCFID